MVFRKHVRTVQVVQGVCAHHRKNETMKPPSLDIANKTNEQGGSCIRYTEVTTWGCILLYIDLDRYIEVHACGTVVHTHTHTRVCMYESYVVHLYVCNMY